MCSLRCKRPLANHEKALIIGAKFAENPPIIGKNWVTVLKGNDHFLKPEWKQNSKKVPMIGAGILMTKKHPS